MDETEKEAIRDRTDIVELISGYTTLKLTGNRFKGLCPFHKEKTPSFTVNPELRRYHCFGCGASGDAFTFLEKMENLTFVEAAERLATRAGITLSRRGVNPEEVRRQQSERDRLFAANAAAVRFFRAAHRKASLSEEYAAKRGLVQETLDAFGIGFAPDDWSQLANFLIHRENIHPEDAIRAGLITASRAREGEFTDRFRGRFMFPIVDVQERVIGFGGRLIVDKSDAPKYLNSPETPIFSKSKTLYALNRARKAIQEQDVAVIVEGYMDVVAAHQAGIQCVVATLGTAMTSDHVTLLRRYTKNIVLSFDADTAGVKAALKAAELIAGAGDDMTLKVLSLPQGEDPDSLIRKGDAAGFRRAIEGAMTVPEFQLLMLKRESPISDPYTCEQFLREAAKIIAPLPNSLTINMLTKRIASTRDVLQYLPENKAEMIVRQEVARLVGERGYSPTDYTESTSSVPAYPQRRWDKNGKPPFRRAEAKVTLREEALPPNGLVASVPNANEKAEQTILRALFSAELLPSVRKLLNGLVEPLAFVNPMTTALFAVLEPAIRTDVSPEQLLARLQDETLAAYADAILVEDGGPSLSMPQVEHAVLLLKKRQIQAKNEQDLFEIAQKEGNGGLNEEKLRQYMLRQKALRSGRSVSDNE